MSTPTKDLLPTNFCILRTKKLRTMGSIAGSGGHTFRELPTPNADSARTHLNVTIGAHTSAALCKAVKDRLPEKRRKDAVLCIEYLITASPEWFKSASINVQDDYFKASTRWLVDLHRKENIVCLNMQHDETSPHLVAYVVPRTKDGRLSAKDFLGGRTKLSKMQTDFHQEVAKPAGLQRGMKGSKAHHTTAKQYNAALKKNPLLEVPEPPAPTLMDKVTGKAKEMEAEHQAARVRHTALVEQARNVALVSQKARQRQGEALAKMRGEIEELRAYKAEADRLRAENKTLIQELANQKRSFLETINVLKEELRQATERITALLHRVGLLDRQLEHAIDEADELRDQLMGKIRPRQNLRPQG